MADCLNSLILILLAFSPTLAELVKECPDGFPTDCGERCYKIVHDGESWTGARRECLNLGGDLASIRDKQEQTCISHIHNTTSYTEDDAHLWIGLFINRTVDPVTNPNLWEWVDPSVPVGPGSYQYWAKVGNDREPNSDGTERCAALVYAENYRIVRGSASIVAWGVWNNSPCYEHKHYLCEKRKAEVPTTTTPQPIPGASAKLRSGTSTPHDRFSSFSLIILIFLAGCLF